ncbi:MAG: hypothetical protein ABIT07_06905 [Ferruginibacter sp.]
MKYFLFVFFLPFAATAQTVHTEKEEIVYSGNVKIKGTGKELLDRTKATLTARVKKNNLHFAGDTMVTTPGLIYLSSPYPVIIKMNYQMTILLKNEGYKYKIDRVYLTEKKRGGKTDTIPSKILLKNMESSGEVAMRTEALLNEIDMRVQQLLAFIKNDITQSLPGTVIQRGKNLLQ